MTESDVNELLIRSLDRLERKVDQVVKELPTKACKQDVATILARIARLEQAEAVDRARAEDHIVTERKDHERAMTTQNKIMAFSCAGSLIVSLALNLPHYL